MAVLKRVSGIKNFDYSAALEYLQFKHREVRNKNNTKTLYYETIYDSFGNKVPRDDIMISYLKGDGGKSNVAAWETDCRTVDLKYRKNLSKDEIKAHHYVLSFSKDDERRGLTLHKAQNIVENFTREVWRGHQALVCTQTDNGHIHTHIVVHSIRAQERPKESWMRRTGSGREVMPSQYAAGGKLVDSAEFKKFRSDMLLLYCKENGLQEFDIMQRAYENKQRQKSKTIRPEEGVKNSLKYKNRNERLRAAITDVTRRARTRKEFEYILMHEYGIKVKWDRMSIIENGNQRYRRLNKLGLTDEILNRCKTLSKRSNKQIDENLKEIYRRYADENSAVKEEVSRLKKQLESNLQRKNTIEREQEKIENYVFNELGWREDGTRRGPLELILILALVILTNEDLEILLSPEAQINIERRRSALMKSISFAEKKDIQLQENIKSLFQDQSLSDEELASLVLLDQELRSACYESKKTHTKELGAREIKDMTF